MTKNLPSIIVYVDPTNPGQFFACCGLLELADRLWQGAEGWFAKDGLSFHIACPGASLEALVEAIAFASLTQVDTNDPYSSPILVGDPFRNLLIDWWIHDFHGARDLKVWAGTMESFGIARAMQYAMRSPEFLRADLFNIGKIVRNPDDSTKKKEPYYFDSRRSTNAHSLDVGFSPNDLSVTSTAHPAVELLSLIGLQIARPSLTNVKRVYDYCIWTTPLPANLILAASTGTIEVNGDIRFRFENWFRTGQKKHKAFRSATPIRNYGEPL